MGWCPGPLREASGKTSDRKWYHCIYNQDLCKVPLSANLIWSDGPFKLHYQKIDNIEKYLEINVQILKM
jgi:hypothetical protein